MCDFTSMILPKELPREAWLSYTTHLLIEPEKALEVIFAALRSRWSEARFVRFSPFVAVLTLGWPRYRTFRLQIYVPSLARFDRNGGHDRFDVFKVSENSGNFASSQTSSSFSSSSSSSTSSASWVLSGKAKFEEARTASSILDLRPSTYEARASNVVITHVAAQQILKVITSQVEVLPDQDLWWNHAHLDMMQIQKIRHAGERLQKHTADGRHPDVAFYLKGFLCCGDAYNDLLDILAHIMHARILKSSGLAGTIETEFSSEDNTTLKLHFAVSQDVANTDLSRLALQREAGSGFHFRQVRRRLIHLLSFRCEVLEFVPEKSQHQRISRDLNKSDPVQRLSPRRRVEALLNDILTEEEPVVTDALKSLQVMILGDKGSREARARIRRRDVGERLRFRLENDSTLSASTREALSNCIETFDVLLKGSTSEKKLVLFWSHLFDDETYKFS